MTNLVAELERRAREGGWLRHRAYLADGVAHTFAGVYAGAALTAGVLADRGVRQGDRVFIALPDGIDVVWSFLGALRLGAVAVLANPIQQPAELRDAARRADPVLAVCEPSVSPALGALPALEPSMLERARASSVPGPLNDVPSSAPAYALFTSGTTGDPKLCVHRHGDPLVHDRAFGRPVLALRRDDVSYSVSKTYFAYGLGNSIFYPALAGATAVLTSGPTSIDSALGVVAELGATVLFSVPTFYARVLAGRTGSWPGGLRLAISAGEVLPSTVEQGIAELGGPVLLNGIGSTEVGQAFASNTLAERRRGTVGRALAPYRVRVVSERGDPVPAGTEGLLEVRGSTVSIGRPALADRMIDLGAGWHRTGDLATRDEDGFLHVHGRADDIEIVGGRNLHPAAVESVLLEHPLVREVAVCAAPDLAGATRLLALVVRHTAPTIDDLTVAAQLLESARRRLAPFKVPKEVIFVPALPRTQTGKLRRRVLRWQAAAEPPHRPALKSDGR